MGMKPNGRTNHHSFPGHEPQLHNGYKAARAKDKRPDQWLIDNTFFEVSELERERLTRLLATRTTHDASELARKVARLPVGVFA
jgi:hypothetical protein